MIDVWLPGFAFSFLVGVFFCGEVGTGKNCIELIIGVGHFPVWHIAGQGCREDCRHEEATWSPMERQDIKPLFAVASF
jgi:hypothetical protein